MYPVYAITPRPKDIPSVTLCSTSHPHHRSKKEMTANHILLLPINDLHNEYYPILDNLDIPTPILILINSYRPHHRRYHARNPSSFICCGTYFCRSYSGSFLCCSTLGIPKPNSTTYCPTVFSRTIPICRTDLARTSVVSSRATIFFPGSRV
jgi:hypothetical protein